MSLGAASPCPVRLQFLVNLADDKARKVAAKAGQSINIMKINERQASTNVTIAFMQTAGVKRSEEEAEAAERFLSEATAIKSECDFGIRG